MKNKILLLVFLSTITLTAFTTLGSWRITEDYAIRFSGQGASGTFSDLEGTIIFTPNNLAASKMAVSVDASTISTGNSIQDKHARGKKWFDVENYPKISFSSKHFEKTAKGYRVLGDLEMHGVTKEVSVLFTFTNAASGGIFEGKMNVNRYDFGIEGPIMGAVVARDFEVQLRVPVTR